MIYKELLEINKKIVYGKVDHRHIENIGILETQEDI